MPSCQVIVDCDLMVEAVRLGQNYRLRGKLIQYA